MKTKLEPRPGLRYLKGTNVPVARTVAQRPSLLKCYFRSRPCDWAVIGPQVTFLSTLSVPFLKNSVICLRQALHLPPHGLQFRRQRIDAQRARSNIGDYIGALNQIAFLRRPETKFYFVAGLQSRVTTQYRGFKTLLLALPANFIVAQQRPQSLSLHRGIRQLHGGLLAQVSRSWPCRFLANGDALIQQQEIDTTSSPRSGEK